MSAKQFGFIGTGNMGGALATAVSKSTKSVLLADHFADKAQALADKLGVETADNRTIAKNCEYIFLGVKPQMMADMLLSIKDELKERQDNLVLVTMAAGLSIDTIRSLAGGDYKVIRIMPNTPVLVEQGEILFCKSSNVSDEDIEKFLCNMKFAGMLTPIGEELMNAGCSVSGCGPAFVYMFIKALAQGGEDCEIDSDTSLKLAAQTVLGSAKLLLESGTDPDILIKNVCSPGGSTIEGVKSLEESKLYDIVRKAVKASYERNVELGKTN
ncbi:MAG: pyrroline-5-carboxylate reductase [Ruminococcus sp.]|nr:pyrroline-5-carboxylate reductase [Ruminococcus sp.]